MVLRVGSHGNDVRKLQLGLTYLKIPCGAIDGVFGGKVEGGVEALQRSQGLYANGVADEFTLQALNKLVPTELQFPFSSVSQVTLATPAVDLQEWMRCPADPLGGGYNNTTLREDAAEAYKSLYEAAHKLGGVVTSAGGKRSLDSGAGPNRSKTSMHYVGRAFDMATGSGLQNPKTDPFLLERVGDTRYWTVWCKSTLSEHDCTLFCNQYGIRGGIQTIPATYLSGGKIRNKTMTGVMFDFTALAARFGFSRISARKAFWDKADEGAAEWWHFSWVTGLVQGVTTFGAELLKVYTGAEASKFIYWAEAKDCVYGVSWF